MKRKQATNGLCGVFVALCLTGIEARAAFTPYGFSGDSGVFTVSCSGPADGGLPNPDNFDNRLFFQAGSDCTVDPLTASATSSFSSGNVTASGSATASFGALHTLATMNTDAQALVLFPAGFADAGWIDTMLLVSQNPADTGQVATASVILNVTGTLFADGPNVTSFARVVVGSDIGGILHTPFYQIQADGSGSMSQSISDTLVLDLPFIIGTPSPFMVRLQARAMTSSATSFGNNTSDVDFLNTVSWGGIQSVSVGGTPITGFTATGVFSNINWANRVGANVVPESSTFVIWSLLGGLGITVGWWRPLLRSSRSD